MLQARLVQHRSTVSRTLLPCRSSIKEGIAPSETLPLQVAQQEFDRLLQDTRSESSISLSSGANGRGLVAARDFMSDDPMKGETLLSIPLARCLPLLLEPPANFGLADSVIAAQRTHLEDLQAPTVLVNLVRDPSSAPPAVRLAIWFAWLCRHAPFWQSYRAFQPHVNSYMSLMRCPMELLTEVQDDEIRELVRKLQAQAAGMAETHESLLAELHISRSDFLWALECTSTRAFFREEDGVRLGLLAPFADMANHVTFPNADFTLDFQQPSSPRFLLQRRPVAGPLHRGDEVFITYGSRLDSISTLVKYGFVSRGNVNDYLPLPAWGRNRRPIRMNLLVDLAMTKLVEPCQDEEQRVRYTNVLRSIPVDGGEEMTESVNRLNPNDFSPYGMRLENESARWMLEQLERTMASYPTTMEEDEAALQSMRADASGLLPVQRFFLALRLERKRMMVAAMDIFKLWLQQYAQKA